MELFYCIRQMTADSRMISLHTGFPQYKVAQVKSELFLKPTEQTKEICDMWLRLYHGEFTKDDIHLLERLIKDVVG